jgi:hypothetical protein
VHDEEDESIPLALAVVMYPPGEEVWTGYEVAGVVGVLVVGEATTPLALEVLKGDELKLVGVDAGYVERVTLEEVVHEEEDVATPLAVEVVLEDVITPLADDVLDGVVVLEVVNVDTG